MKAIKILKAMEGANTLTNAIKIAIAAPILIAINMIFLGTLPSVDVSTLVVNILMAGSAKTTRKAIIIANGKMNPPMFDFTKFCPIRKPVFIKLTLTLVRNKVSPVSVEINPMIIFFVSLDVNIFL